MMFNKVKEFLNNDVTDKWLNIASDIAGIIYLISALFYAADDPARATFNLILGLYLLHVEIKSTKKEVQ